MLHFPSIWHFQSILILNILFDPHDLRQVGQPDSGKCGHVTQLAPSSSAPYSERLVWPWKVQPLVPWGLLPPSLLVIARSQVISDAEPTFLSASWESESEVAQSCPTLCDPMDCSPPGSSVYGIFQARVLEWAAISFSRGSSRPRDWTQVSSIADRCFTIWAIREGHSF